VYALACTQEPSLAFSAVQRLLADDEHVARRVADDLRADRAGHVFQSVSSPDDHEIGADCTSGLDELLRGVAASFEVLGHDVSSQQVLACEIGGSTLRCVRSSNVDHVQARAVPHEVGGRIERSLGSLGAVEGDDDPSRTRWHSRMVRVALGGRFRTDPRSRCGELRI
jgi:hypothetical protein